MRHRPASTRARGGADAGFSRRDATARIARAPLNKKPLRQRAVDSQGLVATIKLHVDDGEGLAEVEKFNFLVWEAARKQHQVRLLDGQGLLKAVHRNQLLADSLESERMQYRILAARPAQIGLPASPRECKADCALELFRTLDAFEPTFLEDTISLEEIF